jgi:hypothetical protein
MRSKEKAGKDPDGIGSAIPQGKGGENVLDRVRSGDMDRGVSRHYYPGLVDDDEGDDKFGMRNAERGIRNSESGEKTE